MEKRSSVDQIRIEPNGLLSVRIAKQVVDDDGSVLANGWHMVTLTPGSDVDEVLSGINANLASEYGYPAIGTDDAGRVSAVASAVWTADVISSYRDSIKDPQAIA